MSDDRPALSPDVELRLPADGAFGYVLRTTTAALAARVDFTLDDIEDLKITVSEALSLLLEGTSPLVHLHVGYFLAPGRMDITLRLPATETVTVDEDGFAWQVLTTLADEVRWGRDESGTTLFVNTRSSVPAA